MSCGPRRGMLPDSKSEQIVLLRSQGLAWAEVASRVGSSQNSCRVLYWKRRHWTKQFSATDPELGPLPLDTRGRRKIKLEATA